MTDFAKAFWLLGYLEAASKSRDAVEENARRPKRLRLSKRLTDGFRKVA